MAAKWLLLCAALQTCVALSARAACRPCAPQAAPLKWIIVGGGPHGVHIATALLQRVPGVTTDNLRIVDDGPELLHAWKTRTRDVGMSHLRSSASNHLDVREDAQAKHNAQLQKRLAKTNWNSGCKSWYLTEDGFNATMFPGFATQYQRQMAQFEEQDYQLVPA